MLKQIADDITDLKVQGATNIAFASLVALRHVINKSKKSSKSVLLRDLNKARTLLFNTRPNEPMMYNAVNYVIDKLADFNGDLRSEGLRLVERLEDEFDEAKKKLALVGKRLIKKNSVILTHCHSSNVTEILKTAKPRIKSVFCTETRPKYQGRITAKELLSAGLKVRMTVDSAIANYVRKADYCFIGCDVISSTFLINKVGSRMISILCDKYDVPLYVCSLSYKFEPESLEGVGTDVELRSPKEVWDKAPRKLKILNPAFDVVDFEGVTGFVTELGVMPPDSFIKLMHDKKGKLFKS